MVKSQTRFPATSRLLKLILNVSLSVSNQTCYKLLDLLSDEKSVL